MPTYTPSNNIKKIGTGDESGTWGDSTNNNFDIIDRASNGFYTLDIQTLDTTGSGTVGSSGRPYVLPLSASALLSIGHYKAIRLTSSGILTADTHLKLEGDNNARVYMMQNDTTANAGINVVVFQGTFSASRSAEVAKYQFAILFADGSGASTSYVRHVTEDISPLTKPLTIIDGTADASAPQLTVESTNTTGLSGPFINLERNPSEAGATDDFLGGVLFTGYNDAGTPEKIIYGSVLGKIKSPTDGAEDGELNFYMGSGGSTLSFLELGHASAQAEVVVNTAGADVDFRVEGDTLPNLFGTEASTDKVLAGTGAARISGPSSHLVQVEGDSSHPAGISVTQSQTTTAGPLLTLAKSKNGTIGSNTIVANNDVLGTISFAGDDGIDLANVAAEIKTVVDGTPASNDIPGAIEFSTTAENESTPTRRLKIFNDGAIGVGTTGSSAAGGASTYSLISLGGNSPPQWLPAPTGRQFIHSVIISDVDYVKFGFPDDTHLSSPFTGNLMFDHNTYHAYEFELVTVVPVTDSVTINAEVYILGSGYDTTANYKLGAGNQSSFRLNGGAAVGNDANEGLTQCYTLYNAHSVSSGGGVIKPLIPSNGRYHSATAIGNASQTIMSYGNGDVSITGIRFGASSGNLSTGRITMYGIRRSFNV
tara:strand:- start:3159 stop:5114 length:1956 start_codon:yes stop_codon:yes gene_type:complete